MSKLFTTATAVVALLGMGMGVPAHAEMQKFNSSGYWQADAGVNDDGVRMCSISTQGESATDYFYFAMKAAEHKIWFHLSRMNWAIPKRMPVRVYMQVDQAEGWYITMYGDGGRNLIGAIPNTDRVPGESWITYVGNVMGAGNVIHITFPQGNTPPWNLSLAGSAAMLGSFSKCLEALDPSIANPAPEGQPYGAGNNGQPYGQQPQQQAQPETQPAPAPQPRPAPIPANPKYYWKA